MPHYNCIHCTYSTKIKGQLSRHTKSNKHRNKLIELGIEATQQGVIVQNSPQIIQNSPTIIQNSPYNSPQIIQNSPVNLFKCSFCPKTFTLHPNKRRFGSRSTPSAPCQGFPFDGWLQGECIWIAPQSKVSRCRQP